MTNLSSDSEPNKGKVVCVVDASSYAGLWTVMGLLQRGYTVHAAVQNGGESEALRKMRDERLKIFATDMLDYHSIVDAVEGCSGLFYAFGHPQCDAGYDLWYALAKTLSEKTAWALAMDRGVNMVTINAALIVGPGFAYQASGPTLAYLKGAAQMYEEGTLACVDVRYLVDAQICAFEDPSAFGRYVCFNQIVNSAEDALNLAQCLRPLVPFPERCEDSRTYQQRLSNKKLNKLMNGKLSGELQ